MWALGCIIAEMFIGKLQPSHTRAIQPPPTPHARTQPGPKPAPQPRAMSPSCRHHLTHSLMTHDCSPLLRDEPGSLPPTSLTLTRALTLTPALAPARPAGKPLLAGSSTVNQIDKIIELCGMPSDEIIYAMDSKYAKKMMDGRSRARSLPPREHRRRQVGERMAPGGAPQEAIDLVTKMLDLDVRKRITIIDTFGEPWMKPFVKENERHLDL